MNYLKYFKRQIPTVVAIVIFLALGFVLMFTNCAPASGVVSGDRILESDNSSDSMAYTNPDFIYW